VGQNIRKIYIVTRHCILKKHPTSSENKTTTKIFRKKYAFCLEMFWVVWIIWSLKKVGKMYMGSFVLST